MDTNVLKKYSFITTMRILSLIIISISCSYCKGQNILKPKDHFFETKWMAPEKYQMTWYAQKDTQIMELAVITTEAVISSKHITVITRVKMKNSNADWTDSSIALKKSFKPVYHSSYNIQRDMVLRFDRGITGYYFDKQKSKKIEVADTTAADYFDSNLYPYLIRLLPLKEGYIATISVYDFNPNGKKGILNAFVKKVESGLLKSNDENRAVWIVTVTDELGLDNNSSSIYYIGKQDRKLLKQEINSAGRKMVMILKE